MSFFHGCLYPFHPRFSWASSKWYSTRQICRIGHAFDLQWGGVGLKIAGIWTNLAEVLYGSSTVPHPYDGKHYKWSHDCLISYNFHYIFHWTTATNYESTRLYFIETTVYDSDHSIHPQVYRTCLSIWWCRPTYTTETTRPSIAIRALICYYRLLLERSTMKYSHTYCYDRRFSLFTSFSQMTKVCLNLKLTREAK